MAAAETLVAMGEHERAEDLLMSKIDYFEHAPAIPHLMGQIAMLRNDPELAIERFTEARVLDAENVQLLEELAWAQYEAEQFGDCIETVRRVQDKVSEQRVDLGLPRGALPRDDRQHE